jgi:uncharacterized protein (DUF1684 family)
VGDTAAKIALLRKRRRFIALYFPISTQQRVDLAYVPQTLLNGVEGNTRRVSPKDGVIATLTRSGHVQFAPIATLAADL